MKAAIYARTSDPGVLHLAERDRPRPSPGEVVVRVVHAGVNPTDWRLRRGGSEPRAALDADGIKVVVEP